MTNLQLAMDSKENLINEPLARAVQVLFETANPENIRRSLEDVFFGYLADHKTDEISQETKNHIYFLIEFLTKAECKS